MAMMRIPPTEAEIAAANEYLALQARAVHPAGGFDNGGRWYPVALCACPVRAPSRAHPYSYLVHMRTAAHVAEVRGVDRNRLLAAARVLRNRA